MKYFKSKTLSVLVLISVSGCSAVSDRPAPININYESQTINKNSLMRMFEMNGNTVLQFFDLSNSKPTILTSDNKVLNYEVVGQQLAVLPGKFESLKIRTVNGEEINIGEQSKATETQADIENAQQILESSAHELAVIRSDLESRDLSYDEIKQTTARVNEIEQNMAIAASKVMRVNFDFNSVVFRPSPELEPVLLASAKSASAINVRGRTDSEVSDLGNYKIALGRALSAREYLINHGIPSTIIKVFSLSSGAFIADNNTEEGKKLNRRVEIEIINKNSLANL